MKVMKVVIDANVYTSALINHKGAPGTILEHLFSNREHYRIIASESIIQEITKVLWYPKVRKYILLDDHDLKSWLAELGQLIEIVDINNLLNLRPIVINDPDDDKYILSAIAGQADYIISGDKDLLKLNPYRTHKIVKPIEFYTSIIKLSVDY